MGDCAQEFREGQKSLARPGGEAPRLAQSTLADAVGTTFEYSYSVPGEDDRSAGSTYLHIDLYALERREVLDQCALVHRSGRVEASNWDRSRTIGGRMTEGSCARRRLQPS